MRKAHLNELFVNNYECNSIYLKFSIQLSLVRPIPLHFRFEEERNLFGIECREIASIS